MLLNWVLIIMLGSIGIYFIAGNARIFWRGYIKKEECSSVMPFLGGIFTAIAFCLIPNNRHQCLFWIPLILDWGCIPIIIRLLYFLIFVQRKEKDKIYTKHLLNIHFSKEEMDILKRITHNQYIIVSNIISECYISTELGELSYNQCFEQLIVEDVQCKRYIKAKPNRIIKYQNYYFMESIIEPGVWYRGIIHNNGNYEFNVSFDNLEEAFKTTLNEGESI